METYTLEKSCLELTDGRLLKKDKKGLVVAAFDAKKIRRATITTSLDGVAIIIAIGVLCLTFVLYRFMPDGIWRWVLMVASGTAFLACTLGIKSHFIVIEIGEDRVQYLALGLPERVCSFVAMINQAKEIEPNQALEPTGSTSSQQASNAVTPPAGRLRKASPGEPAGDRASGARGSS
jgi:hypothetical protein